MDSFVPEENDLIKLVCGDDLPLPDTIRSEEWYTEIGWNGLFVRTFRKNEVLINRDGHVEFSLTTDTRQNVMWIRNEVRKRILSTLIPQLTEEGYCAHKCTPLLDDDRGLCCAIMPSPPYSKEPYCPCMQCNQRE